MTAVIMFHHAQGQTAGFHETAEALRAAGHDVHTPDLYDRRVFDDFDEGIAFAQETGFGTLLDRAKAAAEDLPSEAVYVGFSLGVVAAQMLAQTRPGARGAVLCYSCVPPAEFGGAWPASVPVQIHGMDADPVFVGEGDIDAAREIVASAPDAELFLYPGDDHYFADSSLPTYDAHAAALLMDRVLGFLERV